jgi:hypothetical protein
MNRHVAAPELWFGGLLVAGVYEADHHHPSARVLAHSLKQSAGITAGAHEDDPRLRGVPARFGLGSPLMFPGILHELPPIHRLVARSAAASELCAPLETILGSDAIPKPEFKFSIGHTDGILQEIRLIVRLTLTLSQLLTRLFA